jgi:hypothetical protein
MQQIVVDRRVSNRRTDRPGGRRSTDHPVESSSSPDCPCCGHHATILAGESEGGWWFVCESCDHLWDQRLVGNRASELEVASAETRSRLEDPQSRSRLSSAALSWWRVALGRTG